MWSPARLQECVSQGHGAGAGDGDGSAVLGSTEQYWAVRTDKFTYKHSVTHHTTIRSQLLTSNKLHSSLISTSVVQWPAECRHQQLRWGDGGGQLMNGAGAALLADPRPAP